MGERTLKQAAQEYGYSSDLCEFLDKLEKNLQLVASANTIWRTF